MGDLVIGNNVATEPLEVLLFGNLAQEESRKSLIVRKAGVVPEMVDEGGKNSKTEGNNGECLFFVLFANEHAGEKGDGGNGLN